MTPDKVEDLHIIRGWASAVHGDLLKMASQFPCPELNVAEKHAKMVVEAISAKLQQVEKASYTDFEPVIKFVKELNEGPPVADLDKPNVTDQ